MPRINLRNYLTPAELQEYPPTLITVNNNILIRAEQDIDNIIATFTRGAYKKAIAGSTIYEVCAIDGFNATLQGFNGGNGYLSRTVLEILSGTQAGTRYFISAQAGNILTLSTDTALDATVAVKIYQFGKLPFSKDNNYLNNNFYKVIDQRVKEAVSYQYVYRTENDVDTKYPVDSYSVNGENYSESYSVKEDNTIRERISPQALDILDFLTTQSLT